ncbi:hypothetical protein EMIHUDRAFT_242013 [Emiliania huxleyi CCMP1516]|uniref:Mannosyltransferase n=2 Tax=Emiliania huxleyi TaxID=2903 RepID=A0A0D3JAV6_EMIH1|nr:hypothetical protein EMIHUDRAFT_242013 [Emiliania huxleyi CCMP1516]EOD20641.1 hypothetical protein EMIHUDRAFT_242013 [Emiliania huxleyi CCMP1516]|eukprot:XP_005773070.1 hypothetical protein EMIHUDRAFT_242013 [Emiliania huxleyi CCMP1516]
MEPFRAQGLLAPYVRLWCVSNALRIASGTSAATALGDALAGQPTAVLLGLLTLLGLFPTSPPLLATTLLARAVSNLAKGAALGNSQTWGTLTDLSLLGALCETLALRGRWLPPLSAEEEAAIVRSCAPAVRVQLATVYAASALWKLNSSFAEPRRSCAAVFALQMLEHLPPAVTATPLPALMAAAAPALVLLVETAIPALLLAPCCWAGVSSALSFHLAIAACPPPNNIASFGATTGSGHDWHLCFLVWLAVPLAAAALVSSRSARACSGQPPAPADPPAAVSRGGRWWRRALVGGTGAYAFLLPALGLQERGGCLMFSQLRLHGGSNHLLGAPTGLLQRVLIDAPPENAFAGGVVRVESTSLHWVHNTFAEHFAPHQLALLRAGGFDGGFFPTSKATKRELASPEGPLPRAVRFTLHNLGFRRLLADAEARNDTFSLTYTRLRATKGGGGRAGRHWSSLAAFCLAPQPIPIVEGDELDELHCVSFG